MLLMNIVEQLNSHKYIYLDRLFEVNDLELCILVDEAKVQEDETLSEGIFSSCAPIATDETCKKYRIIFRDYVAYSVRNESFTIWDDEEEFTGNLFRVFSRSKFLDYVAASTVNVEDTVGMYRHFEIACLNQIIDVASSREPQVEEIGWQAISGGAT